jgi:hypothetical protein
MSQQSRHKKQPNRPQRSVLHLNTALAAVALLLTATMLAPAGCGKQASQPDISALKITRYRLNLDDAHDLARIMAEITNFGEQRIPEIAVSASLRGPGERDYSSSTVNIDPGENRAFSLVIEDLKGKERDVDFTMAIPVEDE